jgi:hypothetical protein
VGLLSATLHLTHTPLFAAFALFSACFCVLLLLAWRLVRAPQPAAAALAGVVDSTLAGVVDSTLAGVVDSASDLTAPLLQRRLHQVLFLA